MCKSGPAQGFRMCFGQFNKAVVIDDLTTQAYDDSIHEPQYRLTSRYRVLFVQFFNEAVRLATVHE